MSPFNQSQSPLVAQRDTLGVILKKSDSAALGNVRATCKLLHKDNNIKKMQEDAQQMEALEEVLQPLDISRENIPQAIEQLGAYKSLLSEKFSNKNYSEIKEIAEDSKKILKSEFPELERKFLHVKTRIHSVLTIDQLGDDFYSPESDYYKSLPDETPRMPLDINRIKHCMLRQEMVIAEFKKFYDECYGEEFKMMKEEEILDGLQALPEELTIMLKEVSKHDDDFSLTCRYLYSPDRETRESQENAVAVFFSSQPKIIHAFLNACQKIDEAELDNFVGQDSMEQDSIEQDPTEQDFERPNKKARHY